MQAQESLLKLLQKISSGASGQVPEYRTVMGRQLLFFQQNQGLFILPYSESQELQIMDTASSDYGEFYFMADIDIADGTSVLA